jgi:hypothetical protein
MVLTCLGARVRRGNGGPGAACRHGVVRWHKHTNMNLIWVCSSAFSPNIQTKVHKELITKVADLATSYNFYKDYMVFSSTICAQFACQDANFPGASE